MNDEQALRIVLHLLNAAAEFELLNLSRRDAALLNQWIRKVGVGSAAEAASVFIEYLCADRENREDASAEQ